uniref:Uncharacterized protein n=1 Tax=Anopheles farauti TaxID=69004 RepID=A0A182Q4C8_9DIPT
MALEAAVVSEVIESVVVSCCPLLVVVASVGCAVVVAAASVVELSGSSVTEVNLVQSSGFGKYPASVQFTGVVVDDEAFMRSVVDSDEDCMLWVVDDEEDDDVVDDGAEEVVVEVVVLCVVVVVVEAVVDGAWVVVVEAVVDAILLARYSIVYDRFLVLLLSPLFRSGGFITFRVHTIFGITTLHRFRLVTLRRRFLLVLLHRLRFGFRCGWFRLRCRRFGFRCWATTVDFVAGFAAFLPLGITRMHTDVFSH